MKSGGRALLAAAWLAFHLGGGSPAGPALEQLNRAVRRPLPPLPAARAAPPDRVWVPDRWIDTSAGTFHVPGHWERRLDGREVHVPPLEACRAATGRCVHVPAGVRPPAETRLDP